MHLFFSIFYEDKLITKRLQRIKYIYLLQHILKVFKRITDYKHFYTIL